MTARTMAAALAVLLLVGCKGAKEVAVEIPTVAVERRDIVLDATASGTVEPINVVEVKSKSSGQITRMTVETGSLVSPGDLLVQLDTRDVQNQYDQAKADLDAAEARLKVTEAQKRRSDTLFQQRIITAQENETAQLEFANAQAAAVRARTTADIQLQRLEDATVRAPIQGTVIEKTVSLGQVITSATSSASGGTTILKMANLNQVRMRALFNETDIGSVQAGQEATVIVDAYPDRPFRGTVEKIEPQAVVQQSVTMFPVLVSLGNREGMLKPGMTGEASVLVDRRDAVLAVPNDAVRNVREGVATAVQLGLNPDSVQAEVQRQMAESFGGAGGNGMTGMSGGMNGRPTGGSSGASANTARESRGEVALATAPQQGQQGQRGQQFQMPEVSEQDCANVRSAFAKHPDAQGKLQALFQKVRAGELDMQQMRTESDAIYKTLGVDARVARACQMRDRGQRSEVKGQSGRQDQNTAAPQRGTSSATPNAQRQRGAGPQSGSAPVPAGEFSSVRSRARPALVFISDSGVYKPRVIRIGAANLDYTEVISGLHEGDRVALLSVAQAAAARELANERMRTMTGTGMPGSVPGGTNPGTPGGPPRR